MEHPFPHDEPIVMQKVIVYRIVRYYLWGAYVQTNEEFSSRDAMYDRLSHLAQVHHNHCIGFLSYNNVLAPGQGAEIFFDNHGIGRLVPFAHVTCMEELREV